MKLPKRGIFLEPPAQKNNFHGTVGIARWGEKITYFIGKSSLFIMQVVKIKLLHSLSLPTVVIFPGICFTTALQFVRVLLFKAVLSKFIRKLMAVFEGF